MATIRIDVIADIARRVGDDIRDMQASHDQWGSEDYSDALDSVASLYMLASAQMLYNVYAEDDDEETVAHMTKMLDQATTDATEALSSLTPFGFSYTIHDLIKEMN